MQSLDVISVNLWSIFASVCNLLIIYLLMKKFLYKPVKNMLAKRRSHIDDEYTAANEAKEQALSDKLAYEEKMKHAKQEANAVIQSAVDTANNREQEILAEAKEKADGIVKKAQDDAELELKKAEHSMKQEIVDVSTVLTEKLLEREITPDDHKRLIDSFIEGIGDEDDADKS